MSLPRFLCFSCLKPAWHSADQSHRLESEAVGIIFGARNNIHIIDRARPYRCCNTRVEGVSDTVANGVRILFVGTSGRLRTASPSGQRSAHNSSNSRCSAAILNQLEDIFLLSSVFVTSTECSRACDPLLHQ